MFKLFLIFNFLLINLYACKGGYTSCKAKVSYSHSIHKNYLSIPVSHHKRLIFSRNIPNAKILKQDPFLSLYLVYDKKYIKYPFYINPHISLGMASVTSKVAREGRFINQQVGLNQLASFNEKTPVPSLLLNSCCSLEGIVTPRGIITRDYLQRFISNTSENYGDIGIKVNDDKKNIIVNAINPFIKNNPFKKDDCIVAFDGKKIRNSSTLMKKILFSKVNKIHSVKIKRGKKFLNLKVKTTKRVSGGYLSDTFLEEKGFYFDKNLRITKILKKDYGLKIGDKLLGVNNIRVYSQKDVTQNISKFEDKAQLMILRRGFQFFVKLD